jgi:hypothetical protein
MTGAMIFSGRAGAQPADGASAAPAPTTAEMMEEIRRLRDRVDQLERAAKENPPMPTAQDIANAKAAVQADVIRKEALSNVTVTYDKGLIFKTGDDRFSLRPSIYTQYRYTASLSQGDENKGDESGFEVRRLEPRVKGNVFSADFTYDFSLSVNREGGSTNLLDAYLQYRFARDWAVKFGQYTALIFQEHDMGTSKQLAAERSLLDAILGAGPVDRVQGVALIYGGNKTDAARVEVGYTDSDNSANTDFQTVIYNGNTVKRRNNFGGTARIDYKFLGDWANYSDFTAKGTKETLFVVGAGVDYSQQGSNWIVRSGADAQLELTNGLGFFTAVIVDYLYGGSAAPLGENLNYGGLFQIGYLVRPAIEVFGRYNVSVLEANDYQNYDEITVGFNYYLGPDGSYLHNAKITLDAGYLPNGSPATYTGLGVLQGTEGQYVLRAQFELIL